MRYLNYTIRLTFLISLVTLLFACVEVPKQWDTQGYTVKRGDTLYSIAWRYEKDYRQIAQFNNIRAPYAIYPGQRLRMQAADKDGTASEESHPQVLTEENSGRTLVIDEPAERVPVAKAAPKPTHVKVQKNETLYAIARREGYSHHQLARWNHLRAPYVLKPGQTLHLSPPRNSLGDTSTAPGATVKSAIPDTSPVARPLVRESVKARPLTSTPVVATSLPIKVDSWRWPVKGRVVKTYRANDTGRKGIGIAGRLGQAVKAAAGGTVVYSGNGLINYGNLVIIKHSHSFLSAYAYNQSLLVKEGDTVKRGQTIAKMGKSGANPRLHFEIRRNGKPVNPLNYLPKS